MQVWVLFAIIGVTTGFLFDAKAAINLGHQMLDWMIWIGLFIALFGPVFRLANYLRIILVRTYKKFHKAKPIAK